MDTPRTTTTFPTRPAAGMFAAVLTAGDMVAGTVTAVLPSGGFVLDLDPLLADGGQQHTAGEHAVWEPLFCAWFAKCDNPAVRLIAHPVLVAVPACDRCTARAAA